MIKKFENEKSEIVKNNFYDKWNEMIEIFLGSIDASGTTKGLYHKASIYFVKWMSENGIKTPTEQNIVEYKKYLIKNVEPSTVNAYLTGLKRFYKFLAVRGISPDITCEIKLVKIPKGSKRDILTTEQQHKLIEEVKSNTRDFIITILCLKYGFRSIEIERANCDALTTVNGQCAIKVYGKGHTSDDVILPISSKDYDLISGYIGTLKNNKPNEPLFRSGSNNSKGERLTTSGMRRIFGQHFKNINIHSRKINFHSLRTSMINTLIDESNKGKIDIMDVALFCRHENINTTIQNYLNVNMRLEKNIRAMKSLENIYNY